MEGTPALRIALVEAGSPGLNIYSGVAMGRGIPILSTVVRDAGYDVRAFIEDVSGRDSTDWDWVRHADVIGFSAITCTIPRTAELIRQARDENPRAVILLGGPEPTCDPERSFALGADLVLRGEAELTLPRLLAVLAGTSSEHLEDIPGLMWREEGLLREGPPYRQLTRAELDALPLVDRSLIHQVEKSSVASVWRARGCPSRCDFCEVCEIWPRYVTRSPGKTVEELVQAEQDGYATAFLIDDNAAADKPAFKRLLQSVAESGFSRMLVTQLRADSIFTKGDRLDRELLRLLKKAAAVTVVCVGVESADDADLERMNKGIDSRRMGRALKAMRRRGLMVHGMFIALAEDSREVLRRNGDFARKYVSSLQYLFETPLPGTKRTRKHVEDGNLLFDSPEDLSFYDGMHVVVKPDVLAPTEMQSLVLHAYRRFYSVRRIVGAALSGALLRFRRLTEQQRAHLATLGFKDRIRSWAWFHIRYKFAPVTFLAMGRKRVHAFLEDAAYAQYNLRLQEIMTDTQRQP